MMQRSLFIGSLVFVFLTVSGPLTASAHEGTEIAVEGQVRADGSIDLEGQEFAPNDVVRIELRKDGIEPILLGNVHADEEGEFNEALHVPASVKPGIYGVAADGKESATTTVLVLGGLSGSAEPGEGTAGILSRDRSTGEKVGLGAFTLFLAAGGFFALWFGGRRVHHGGA